MLSDSNPLHYFSEEARYEVRAALGVPALAEIVIEFAGRCEAGDTLMAWHEEVERDWRDGDPSKRILNLEWAGRRIAVSFEMGDSFTATFPNGDLRNAYGVSQSEISNMVTYRTLWGVVIWVYELMLTITACPICFELVSGGETCAQCKFFQNPVGCRVCHRRVGFMEEGKHPSCITKKWSTG